MKIFAISDLHIDYSENMNWLINLSHFDYSNDILILAGDISDLLAHIKNAFAILSKLFKRVHFVPGNHDLWVMRNKTKTSIEQFEQLKIILTEYNISMEPCVYDGVTIVPLFGWYDYSFGAPHVDLEYSWMDYKACVWPEELLGSNKESNITQYFTAMNDVQVKHSNDVVISFSHFLPRIDLMPDFIPQQKRKLYPVFGTDILEDQVRELKSSIHLYGHSHFNRDITINSVRYINNAFGYPSESIISRKQLMMIHEL